MPKSGGTLSPTALAAADIIHQHHGTQLLPDLLIKRLHIERWEAVSALKELAEVGYGSFVVGRRGGKTRLEKAEILPQDSPVPLTNASAGASKPREDQQVFLLRRTPPVHVSVPADLTSGEAETLGKWLLLVALGA